MSIYKDLEDKYDPFIWERFSLDDPILFEFKQHIPRPEFVFQDRKIAPWDVAIKRLNIAISARPGDGKDHTARGIAKEIREVYPGAPIFVESTNPYQFFENMRKSEESVQIHIYTDITNVFDQYTKKERSDLADMWTKRRHIMYETTNNPFGLLVTIMIMHRLYGTPPPFNGEYDWTCVKSRPDNQFDQQDIAYRFGIGALKYLKLLERAREVNDYYIGYGLIKTKSIESVFYTPLIIE